MSRRVVATDGFERTLSSQIAHLFEQDRSSWIDILAEDIRRLSVLLSEFPRSGQLVGHKGRSEVRRIRLKRAPFMAWYRLDLDDEAAPVILFRLFHVRQRS